MATLEKFFDIIAGELATKEPERVIVKKNRKLRRIEQRGGRRCGRFNVPCTDFFK
jgi:hypothetical protein